MCNGLRVREITSPKSAYALSVVARTVSGNLPEAREGTEFPARVSGQYPSYFGSRRSNPYPTVSPTKSCPCSPLGNSIERALTTKQNQTNSFESQDNRTRGVRAFRFRETVGSITSGYHLKPVKS